MQDEPLYKQKACRHGVMLYNPRDLFIGRSLDLYGEFSEGEADLFRQILREGDIALDVGANIGCHTVVMAKQVGNKGVVVAIEPQRLIFQLLSANMALNGLTNVWCLQKAVTEDARKISVPDLDPRMEANFGGVGLQEMQGSELTESIRIDDLQLEHCRLIKLDVEGMEIEALRSASDTIERLRPILYVENDREENSDELFALITSFGYQRIYWHTPPLFRFDNFFGNLENVFENISSINMLCIPKEANIKIEGFPE